MPRLRGVTGNHARAEQYVSISSKSSTTEAESTPVSWLISNASPEGRLGWFPPPPRSRAWCSSRSIRFPGRDRPLAGRTTRTFWPAVSLTLKLCYAGLVLRPAVGSGSLDSPDVGWRRRGASAPQGRLSGFSLAGGPRQAGAGEGCLPS